MKKVIGLVDNFICKFIGINQQQNMPDSLRKIKNRLVIVNTESFRRHTKTEKIDQFLLSNINSISAIDKQKIGISIGKILAKNLIVSFDNLVIQEKKND